MTSLLWFRRDLRLGDHPALAAAAHDDDVLGVFVIDDALMGPSGAPRRHFLVGCLTALSEQMDGRLLILHGRPESVIPRVAAAVDASAVHVSADFGPYGHQRDEKVRDALGKREIELVATGSAYAIAPGRITKPDGSPYSVFTPYFRAWTDHGWRGPASSGKAVRWVDPEDVDGPPRYELTKVASHVSAETSLPEPGELAAGKVWQHFLDEAMSDYDTERNRPDHPGSSRLSPYLKWGCIHPRTLLADLARRRNAGATAYRRELAFREFYADLLFRQPDAFKVSADPVIDKLPWDTGTEADRRFEAWKAGRTGYPYIDAGMRQLLAEGWMHNRVRMGVASFLIKDLHLAWQLGARHFMQHLVDGDVASNSYGWQWVAGSGAQAAPYYRVFNPILQGTKFDPTGDYVRKYVPELAAVEGKAVHTPWDLPEGPPAGYPDRIVEHDDERRETLRRWSERPSG